MMTHPDPDELWPVAQPEPPPVPGQADVLPALIAYMEARAHAGLRKYGVPLQPHNGRSALRDALDEACDQAMYLMQATMEQPRFRLGQQVRYRPHHAGPAWDAAKHANTAPSPCDADGWHAAPWRVVSLTVHRELWHTRPVITYGLAPWDAGDASWNEARPVVPVDEENIAPWEAHT